MEKERSAEKASINWDLSIALQKWKIFPDAKGEMAKLQHLMDHGLKEGKVAAVINKKALKKSPLEEGFVFPGVAGAYGKENEDVLEFDSGNFKMRIEGGYLFLEKNNQRFASFRPGLITQIRVE